jgi:hypothetical protein
MTGWEQVAHWSPWVPFVDAAAHAPSDPGVYVVRSGVAGPVVYVGMAGERRGRGLRGRLQVYASGKAATSGLGEAALNRALADPNWLRNRLAELEAGQPRTAKQWARAAIDHWDLYVCWATVTDKAEAIALERRTLTALTATMLWNLRR